MNEERKTMNGTTIRFYLVPLGAMGILLGIGIASFAPLSVVVLVTGGVVGGFALMGGLWRVDATTVLVGIIFLCFVVGAARFLYVAGTFADIVVTDGDETTVAGIVREIPDRRRVKTIVVVADEIGRGVRVTLPPTVDVEQGDRLVLRGSLHKPKPFDGFDYPAFLRSRNVHAVMMYPDDIEHTPHRTMLTRTRVTLLDGIGRSLPGPEGALASALLLGERRGLSGQEEILVRSGTRHIVAISGLHMMLLFAALLAILVWVGLRRPWASIGTIALLAAYVILIGLPASAVRALLFVVALEGARMVGRERGTVRTLVLAAAGMALWNPFVVRWDVGYQLSFAAVMGIATITPVLQFRLAQWFPPWMASSGAMTLGAMVTTLPFIAYDFNRVSLIAPVSNLIVLPLLPWMILGALIAAAAGWLLPSVVGILLLPVWVLFRVVQWMLTILASIPTAAVAVSIPTVVFVGWLAVVGWLVWGLQRRRVLPRWEHSRLL